MSITTDTNLTLEEIARRSGVSRSTVSRVINQHPNVSQIVRERVQAVIEDTGYQPNLAAQTLVSKRTSMIGLVLPRSVSSFFTDPYFRDYYRVSRKVVINTITPWDYSWWIQ